MIQETANEMCIIAVGMPVYGADGTPWGRITAANAHFVTIAQGTDGIERFDLPIAFVSRVHDGRVQLTLAVADAK
jgi:hypothetical protein